MDSYSNNNPNQFTTPTPENFDTAAMQGSFQSVLQDNLGAYVQIEFLLGTQGISTRLGVLYAVGRNYVVLYDVGNRNYIVCDIFSIKFITFFSPDGQSGYIFPYYLSDQQNGMQPENGNAMNPQQSMQQNLSQNMPQNSQQNSQQNTQQARRQNARPSMHR